MSLCRRINEQDALDTMDSLCPVCFDPFGGTRTPMLLGCGHSVCDSCLKLMAKAAKSRSVIKCPECRITTGMFFFPYCLFPKKYQTQNANPLLTFGLVQKGKDINRHYRQGVTWRPPPPPGCSSALRLDNLGGVETGCWLTPPFSPTKRVTYFFLN